MSSRVSVKEVRAAFVRLESAMRDVGMLAGNEALSLQEGSQTYGRAWRMYKTIGDGSGALHNPPFGMSNYLGWSGAEALSTIVAIADTIHATSQAIKEGSR